MAQQSWISRHPWMTFFLISGAVGAVGSVLVAALGPKTAAAPAQGAAGVGMSKMPSTEIKPHG